jgi:hypothetical protein
MRLLPLHSRETFIITSTDIHLCRIYKAIHDTFQYTLQFPVPFHRSTQNSMFFKVTRRHSF